MTWGGIAPSGYFATINIASGVGSVDYEVARGDATGLIDNLIVIGIRERPVSSLVPVSGDVLAFNGTSWTPTDISVIVSGIGPHDLLSTEHIDTVPSVPTDGSLITGSGAPASWVQFPIGIPNQQLRVSESGRLEWAFSPIEIVTSGTTVNLDATKHRVIINKSVGSATFVNLPPSPFLGQEILIKDGKGDANVNAIHVLPPSGLTIDGLNEVLLRQNFQSYDFLYNGTGWNIV